METKMTWQSYEELVKDIYRELGKSVGVKVKCWGATCKVKGQNTGLSHQVDVLTTHTDGIHTYRTAIDCKYWNKRVSKGPVLELAGVLDDANLDKGVLVSKCGFTSGAKVLARTKNICLVQLREPRPSDWNGYVKTILGQINLIVDEIYDYNVTCSIVDSAQKTELDRAGIALRVEVDQTTTLPLREIADKVRHYDASEKKEYVEDRWIIECSSDEHTREYTVHFRDGAALTHPSLGQVGTIKKLGFRVREVVVREEFTIDHADHVAWIMETIFEGNVFAISPDGVPTQWE